MEFKYAVSNYDPITNTAVPVAVFDDEESAKEYATLTFGDTVINDWELVDKVVSFIEHAGKVVVAE